MNNTGHYISIKVKDVPNLDIFATSREGRIEMARLGYLYKNNTKELEDLQKNSPDEQDTIDYHMYNKYTINIWPKKSLLVWVQENFLLGEGAENYGSIRYNPGDVEEVMKRVFDEGIRYKEHF
nr:hypothetical protein Cplu_443 [Cedratvirus plubellavi]